MLIFRISKCKKCIGFMKNMANSADAYKIHLAMVAKPDFSNTQVVVQHMFTCH